MTTPNSDPTSAAGDPEAALRALRDRLDRLDDALLATLMARAEVVVEVGALRAKGPTPLRPGREAAIIRRLLAGHHGPLPRQTVTRIWRELLSGTTLMQGPILITVCDPLPAAPLAALAREHFGALIPMRVTHTPSQAIREVSGGRASVAVLPMPVDGEPSAWWTALLHRDETRIHVVARLPFWSPRPEGAAHGQALVVSAAAPDPSGRDRTLLGFELPADISRGRLQSLFAGAGLPAPRDIILRREASAPSFALVALDTWIAEGDRRLAALGVPRPPVVLGAYAEPIEEKD